MKIENDEDYRLALLRADTLIEMRPHDDDNEDVLKALMKVAGPMINYEVKKFKANKHNYLLVDKIAGFKEEQRKILLRETETR